MNEDTPKLNKAQVRALFWHEHPEADRRKVRDHSGKGRMYKTDTRVMFCDFVEFLHRDGKITDATAQTATLS